MSLDPTRRQLQSLDKQMWDFLTNTSTLSLGKGTATGATLAVTLNAQMGVVTTEAFSTAASTAVGAYVITNNQVTANSRVFVNLASGTNTTGTPVISTATPSEGAITVNIHNVDTAAALNGTLVISFIVF